MDNIITQEELVCNLVVLDLVRQINVTKVIRKPTEEVFEVLCCYLNKEWSLERTHDQFADLFV
jgi:hypothetical protein